MAVGAAGIVGKLSLARCRGALATAAAAEVARLAARVDGQRADGATVRRDIGGAGIGEGCGAAGAGARRSRPRIACLAAGIDLPARPEIEALCVAAGEGRRAADGRAASRAAASRRAARADDTARRGQVAAGIDLDQRRSALPSATDRGEVVATGADRLDGEHAGRYRGARDLELGRAASAAAACSAGARRADRGGAERGRAAIGQDLRRAALARVAEARARAVRIDLGRSADAQAG
ncbi:MAG: hypothetical protein EOO76_08805 [Novosphingobium sp.]|nr:MAG: hypothetical protein EOO76_08805 [Novosphingobium sp.]